MIARKPCSTAVQVCAPCSVTWHEAGNVYRSRSSSRWFEAQHPTHPTVPNHITSWSTAASGWSAFDPVATSPMRRHIRRSTNDRHPSFRIGSGAITMARQLADPVRRICSHPHACLVLGAGIPHAWRAKPWTILDGGAVEAFWEQGLPGRSMEHCASIGMIEAIALSCTSHSP